MRKFCVVYDSQGVWVLWHEWALCLGVRARRRWQDPEMGHRFGMPMAIGSIVVAFFMVTQCCLVYDGPNEVAHQLRPRGPVVMILVLPTFAVAIYLSLVEQSLVFYEESLSSA